MKTAKLTRETIMWRRLDVPGHEAARLTTRDGAHVLAGTALFLYQGLPCRLEYSISCSPIWETVAARVEGWVGHDEIEITMAVDASRRWQLNGSEVPGVAGCIDLDLHFSPSTNLLPIRRLDLQVGQFAHVTAAWLRFPSIRLEPLPQTYRRIGERTYRYESAGGSFVRDLTVSETGHVIEYPGFWSAEMPSQTIP
jgi:hypothetical protein